MNDERKFHLAIAVAVCVAVVLVVYIVCSCELEEARLKWAFEAQHPTVLRK